MERSRAQTPRADATPAEVQSFGFLLVPQFSMISFTAVLEPLRMANRESGKSLYRWEIFSQNDKPVAASNGLAIPPTAPLAASTQMHTLIVVAGIDAHLFGNRKTSAWLHRLARHGVHLGATSTGTLLLARAGLLDGYRCTIHWENLAGLREEFPQLNISSELYEIDRQRLTCSGGIAGLDLMLHLIALRHGHALASAVSEQCIHPNIRPAHERQRMALEHRLEINHPRLVQVIAQMESHLDDPLAPQDLAATAGLSLRQLERLFKEHLGHTASRFYLGLRLQRARALLQQTSLPMVEVAAACGFVSVSHFGRCYRERFGHTPGAERARSISGLS